MQADVHGIPVHYLDEGEGRPIIVIHGRPGYHNGPAFHFEPIFTTRPGWRRIYPDLPGMGLTPGADWIVSQRDVLTFLSEFIDTVIPGQRFTVAGQSFGGYMVLGLAHLRPGDLDGVMLWAPAVQPPHERSDLPEHTVFASDPAVVASVSAEERMWLEVSVVHTADTLAAFRAAVKPGFAMADMPFLERVEDGGWFDFDATQFTEPLTAPTLLLAGRQDSMVGYAEMVGLLEAFPRATLAVVDRAGHALASEQPSIFRTLVGEWLDRVVETAAATETAEDR